MRLSFDGTSYRPLTPDIAAAAPLPGGRSPVVLRADGRLESFDGSAWSTLTGGITAIASLADGRVAVLPSNGALQTYDGRSWASLSGGITAIAPLTGGRVAVLPANGALQTFDGKTWASLTGGAHAVAPLPDGRIGVLTANGALSVFDGQSWSDLARGVLQILPQAGGSLKAFFANGDLQVFDGSEFIPDGTIVRTSAAAGGQVFLIQGGQRHVVVGPHGSVAADPTAFIPTISVRSLLSIPQGDSYAAPAFNSQTSPLTISTADGKVLALSLEEDGDPVLTDYGTVTPYKVNFRVVTTSTTQSCVNVTFGVGASICKDSEGTYSLGIGLGNFLQVSVDTSAGVSLGGSVSIITGFGGTAGGSVNFTHPGISLCGGIGVGEQVPGGLVGASITESQCVNSSIQIIMQPPPPPPPPPLPPTPVPAPPKVGKSKNTLNQAGDAIAKSVGGDGVVEAAAVTVVVVAAAVPVLAPVMGFVVLL